MRLGFAIGNKELIKGLKNIKFSFNSYTINRLSILAGIEAFKDEEYFKESVSKNYFNSGVLLIDCIKWRNEEIVGILLETAKEYANQVLYGDQCILNMVLREKSKNIMLCREYSSEII